MLCFNICRRLAAGLPLLAAPFAMLSCVTPDPQDVEDVGDTAMSFEEFEARTYREPDTGVYIVDGDVPIADIEGLRGFFQRYVLKNALIVNQVGGADDRWSDTQKRNLTYCVSKSFNANYGKVVKAMDAAAAAWEATANVDFIHLSAQDSSCNASNANVVFDVHPTNWWLLPYYAHSFPPSWDRSLRSVAIDGSAFGSIAPFTLEGILRHELGHTLGFRHEHIRPESGAWDCINEEDSQWRALTSYDSASVMHFPDCNGTNTGDLVLTDRDRSGAMSLYPFGSFSYQGDAGWWGSSAYSPDAITGRMVSGDYDGDGRDDVAMLYKYGASTCRIHVLLSTGSSFQYQGDLGWWGSSGCNPDAITGRMVSGDYNGDGRDDIAWFYKYDATWGRAHVLLSTGSSFQFQGDLGWWGSSAYSPDAITGRMVSGDYNGDGRDDIAMLYKYGASTCRVHVLLSTGSSFQYQGDLGWWGSSGCNPDAITGRMVSGDYNGDGRDDIAWFYKYDATWGRAHVLLSTGSSFQFQGDLGWWGSSAYSPDAITGRMVSGDYDGDGRDDVAMLYKYGASTCRVHVLRSTGSSFQFQGDLGWWGSSGCNPDAITGRMVSGDYNGDGRDDIAWFYKYDATWGRAHVLLSQ